MTVTFPRTSSNDETKTVAVSPKFRLFRFLWYHPDASLKDASRELHMSYAAVKQNHIRLKRSNLIDRLCPECFKPARIDLQCYACGVDLSKSVAPMLYDPESYNPVFSIQPGNGLGSAITIPPGLSNSRTIIKQQIMKTLYKDDQFEKAKSELLEFLKATSPPENVTESAYKLLKAEFGEFKMRYPGIRISTAIRKQLIINVERRLQLIYPTFIHRW